MMVTCYVLEDGSIAHPRDVKRDANGILRHADGRSVAMRGDVPRTRSAEIEENRQMQPHQSGPGYVTRGAATGSSGVFDHDGDSHAGGSAKPADPAGDLAAVRAEYQTKFGKRPFAGWDAAALREKIDAKAE